jgi:flagellar biosynthetic protein FlhB
MAGRTGERTERPTPRRIKDAREKGQIARSRDLSAALSLGAVTLALAWLGTRMVSSVGARLSAGLAALADRAHGPMHPGDLAQALWAEAGTFALVAGPPACLAAIVSIGASVAQTGWAVSPKAIAFEWNRLNPASGLAKFAPRQGGMELVKAVIGLAVIGWLGHRLVLESFVQAPGLIGMTPVESARVGWTWLWTLLWQMSLAFLALAAADYALQRWRWLSNLKMTRQEVRDEARLNDGNPEVKGRVRRIQREMARRRMLHAVKTATVVVTNPTHFAVALQYRRHEMAAPVVVAKGQDELARRIREMARKHEVPVVENVTLARALYKSAEVGDTIPADLFGAVAEVLAYLVRLKQLIL